MPAIPYDLPTSSSSLVELIREHAGVLCERAALKPYVDRLQQSSFTVRIPEDAGEYLSRFGECLPSLVGIVQDILAKSEAMCEADAEKRSELGREIGHLSATQEKLYSEIESLFLQMFDVDDSGVDSERSSDSLAPSAPGVREGEGGGKNRVQMAEEASHVESLETKKRPKPPESSGHSASPESPEIVLEDAGAYSDLKSTVEATETLSDPSGGDHNEGLEAINSTFDEREDDIEPAGRATASETPGESRYTPPPSEALNKMLSSGRFARAYWLTRADPTLGDPDLFGALAEGVRVGPGGSCPGALTQFFSGLTRKDHWEDDERLLLGASVLAPCLFVDPLPQDIYLLAEKFPPECSPIGNLMEHILALCVRRDVKVRPEDLGVESTEVARADQLNQLAREAAEFLARVPLIRFQYAPANRAIQYLYRPGSKWHQLHEIVSDNQNHRLNEMQALIQDGDMDPIEVVNNLHSENELNDLRQPLEGNVRNRLIRYLCDTLALAQEWSVLSAATGDGNQGGNRNQLDELLGTLGEVLPAARNSLKPYSGRGPIDAVDIVLGDLEARLQNRTLDERASVSGDLLLLPDLLLEDELEPPEDHHAELKHAILEAEHSDPEPNRVLTECLDRHEYRRARQILDTHELEEWAQDKYQQAVNEKRALLRNELETLKLQVEDAFLLGQLRDDADMDVQAPNPTSNVVERSQMLGVVQNAEDRLNRFADTDADELRNISIQIHEVAEKITEMRTRHRERLDCEFSTVLEQLPRTDQGESDRRYLREAFDGFLKHDDHLAASDLLDRAHRAAQTMALVERPTTDSGGELDQFLKRADEYQEALSQQGWFNRVEESIDQGSIFSGISFDTLDHAHRDEVLNALQDWNFATQLRFFRQARRELKESMIKLLRFIGLPLKEDGIDVLDISQDAGGFAHVRAELARPIMSSPLPAFGSARNNRYDIVVSKRQINPVIFEEYIRARRLADRPVLALLLCPQGSSHRVQWRSHFMEVQLTVLPLDLAIFFHLCREQNPLPVLFKLALPFTWTQPYIIMGENVAAEMFVGRSEETAELMNPKGSCIIFGGRQLGKSALLRHVRRKYNNPNSSTYVVYLDVDDLGNDSEHHDLMVIEFWRRVYDELVRSRVVSELPQKALDGGNRLVKEAHNSILTHLSEKSEMRIVLLLDETDGLLDCDFTSNFTLVRQLRAMMASSERRFKVVFAGLQSVQRYSSWTNQPFAQLGLGQEIVLNPLPPAPAQELIIRPLRALGFVFDDIRLVLRILSLTNYHPGLIQIFCYRLLESLFNKRRHPNSDSPVRKISSDDLLAVERNPSIIEEIRNRFDWTLDLDDRYKVLTYALVLEPDPSAPRSEEEFRKIGAYWWDAVFGRGKMDAKGLRAVLDEMVGLGVLLNEHEYADNRRKYRLRSPNLLRLLGPQEAIESELLRLIEQDQVSRLNPKDFHPLIGRQPVAFGPLTNEQEAQIDRGRQPFQLTIVSGSEALGLGDVERQFDRLISDSERNQQDKTWKKIPSVKFKSAIEFVQTLLGQLKARGRPHHLYSVIRLGDIEYDGKLSALLERILRELGRVCTNTSRGHLILLLDPSDTWRWLGDRNREQLLARPRVTGLELRRWSDGAIAHAFDRLEARTGSRPAGDEVFKLTSGFHSLVNQGLSQVTPVEVTNAGNNAGNFVELWKAYRDEALADGMIETALLELGLGGRDPQLVKCVRELFRCRDTIDGRPALTKTSFALAIDEQNEVLEDADREWFKANTVQVRKWMRILDLAHPLSPPEEDPMVMAPWVQDVFNAVGD